MHTPLTETSNISKINFLTNISAEQNSSTDCKFIDQLTKKEKIDVLISKKNNVQVKNNDIKVIADLTHHPKQNNGNFNKNVAVQISLVDCRSIDAVTGKNEFDVTSNKNEVDSTNKNLEIDTHLIYQPEKGNENFITDSAAQDSSQDCRFLKIVPNEKKVDVNNNEKKVLDKNINIEAFTHLTHPPEINKSIDKIQERHLKICTLLKEPSDIPKINFVTNISAERSSLEDCRFINELPRKEKNDDQISGKKKVQVKSNDIESITDLKHQTEQSTGNFITNVVAQNSLEDFLSMDLLTGKKEINVISIENKVDVINKDMKIDAHMIHQPEKDYRNSISNSTEQDSGKDCKLLNIVPEEKKVDVIRNKNKVQVKNNIKILTQRTHILKQNNGDIVTESIIQDSEKKKIEINSDENEVQVKTDNIETNDLKNNLEQNNKDFFTNFSVQNSFEHCRSINLVPEKKEIDAIINENEIDFINKDLEINIPVTHKSEKNNADYLTDFAEENFSEDCRIVDQATDAEETIFSLITSKEIFKENLEEKNVSEEVHTLDDVNIENCEFIFEDEHSLELINRNNIDLVDSTIVLDIETCNLNSDKNNGNDTYTIISDNSKSSNLNKPKIIDMIVFPPGVKIVTVPSTNDDNKLLQDIQLPNSKNNLDNCELEEAEEFIPLPEDDNDDDDDLRDVDYLPQRNEQSDGESDDESDDEEVNGMENYEDTINSTNKSTVEESNISSSSFSLLYAVPGKSSISPTNLKVLSSKGKSGKSKSHFCLYCKTMQLSIARHLERQHSNEKLVQNFMSLKKGTEERRKAIEKVRKKGDFLHNTDSNLNQGFLITVRRSQVGKERMAEEMINCPKCSGFYSQNNIRHHYADCSESKFVRTRTLLQKASRKIGRVHKDASLKMRQEILPVLRKNDLVTNVIRYDRLIILYGNLLCIKHKLPHQDNMIRSQLRLLGRFLLALRKVDQNVDDLASAFHPTLFEKVLMAVNIISRFNERTQKYGAPSTAFAVGTALKKCSQILKCEYIIMMDKEKKGLVEEFMVVFDTKFGIYINRNVTETQIDMKRQKTVILPKIKDISKLSSYLKQERNAAYDLLKKEFSINEWKRLNEAVLIYLMVFNRRRRGEIQLLTLEDYENRQEINENDDTYKALPEEDKKSAQEYKRLLIRGKKHRPVPVLVCQENLECMAFLKENRQKAGINKKNTYFFAVPSLDGDRCQSLEACELLRKFSNLCGAEKPETLRGTTLRKHLATTCATKCSESQISQVANFMGHDLKIHKEYYQQPTVAIDIIKISNVLKDAQSSDSGKYIKNNNFIF